MQKNIAACLMGMLAVSAACGHKKSSGSSPSPSPTVAPTGGGGASTGSAVDDSSAQKDATSQQLNTAVSALSDGGSGGGGGGGGGAGLVDYDLDYGLTAFSETRGCTAGTVPASGLTMTGADGSTWTLAASAPMVTIARTYSGTQGAVVFGTNADGSASGDTEAWYPGPYFGLQNIAPDSASVNYGTVPVPASGNALPAIPSPNATAAAGSSGKVGSVGWRSTDGSWTGSPVWEVGTGYVAVSGGQAVAASQTQGMAMYYTSNMPSVTPAGSAPTVGGAYAATQVFPASNLTATNHFSVLGQLGGGALPSFQSTGKAVVSGIATVVGQAGTVTAAGLPGKLYNPPAALACAADGFNAAPGWRFSQNVAGLTKLVTNKTSFTRAYAKGSAAVTTVGTRTVTWSDPALVVPAKTAGSAYFDQNAGTVTLTRNIQIGSQAKPNTITSEFTPTGGTARPAVTMTAYTSAPLVDTVVRNLLDPSWSWVTRTVASGTINTAHATGTATPDSTIATTFSNVQWTYNSDKAKACIPTSGTITTLITPADTAKQATTITLKFGTSAGITSASGVTATVACSGGSAGATNCTAAGEVDDPDYKPSGCSF